MQGKEMERRDFLKTAVVAGASMTAAGMLSGCSGNGSASAASVADIKWTTDADVVIVGGGGAGFCAAIEAAQAGASVIILEKGVNCGGSTALSGGMILGAATDWQASLANCTTDTAESFVKQQVAYSCGLADEAMITEMCTASADEVKFMTDLGRVYTAVNVVPPIWAYDTDGTWAPRCHWDPSAQGGHFICLQDKASTLENITIKKSTEGTHLITDGDNGVVGVEARTSDGTIYVKAHKGVVIATSGVDDNLEMAKQFNAQQAWGDNLKQAGLAGQSTNAATNTGDGIRMGMEIGAALHISQACVMAETGYMGGVGVDFYSAYEHVANPYSSTSIIGEILVNCQGERFVQEDADWGYVTSCVFQERVRTGANPSDTNVWGVTDADHLARWQGFGIAPAAQGNTIEELATAMDVPVANLAKTIERWNTISTSGEDPDLLRRTDFGVIAKAPFYAYKDYCSSMGSAGGLKINIDTQVLDTSGEVIPRLYAGGMASGGWVGPFYPGCGWAVLGTVHWGRKAGKNAAALASWDV